jgi:hypothetical protein
VLRLELDVEDWSITCTTFPTLRFCSLVFVAILSPAVSRLPSAVSRIADGDG